MPFLTTQPLEQPTEGAELMERDRAKALGVTCSFHTNTRIVDEDAPRMGRPLNPPLISVSLWDVEALIEDLGWNPYGPIGDAHSTYVGRLCAAVQRHANGQAA